MGSDRHVLYQLRKTDWRRLTEVKTRCFCPHASPPSPRLACHHSSTRRAYRAATRWKLANQELLD
ncbi:hypothetical protein E2C01_079047 [Portunus trituberculatus]|uniref:Uncharacterized protein n=1 Tax=Portunus trituberculatus TaxID=210409 RepID=A0A5B7IIN0_PORTR|nr:hypothetical protein [Portunus trituberculatus]